MDPVIRFRCKYCGESCLSTVIAKHRFNVKRFGSCERVDIFQDGEEPVDTEMVEIVNCRRRINPISIVEGITIQDVEDWT